jgi:serine/threonine-protein kinase
VRRIWQRLKQRKVATWTAAYVTAAAALFGTLEAVGDVFAWPDPALQAVVFLLLAGLIATILLAWLHGDRGRQKVTLGEALLLALVGALGVAGAASSLAGLGARGHPGDAPASIVVLPFTDESPDDDQAYLGHGVAEEIRRALSARQGVPVGRGASAGVAGAHVVEGSVRRIGDDIRVTALLSGADGRERWSERFEVPMEQLFDVEDRIVAAVSERLGPRETGLDAHPTRPRLDPEAHDAYLRGEHALRQRTPASVIRAIAQYRAASALNPEFPAALAREAYAYSLFVDWGWVYPGLGDEDLLRRGMDLSERALELDSVSPEGWLSKAYLTQLSDPVGPVAALTTFSRAVALDPANPEAHHQYGQTLTALGRYPEARAAYHAALAIDPERPMTLVPLSAIALREGDVDAARRWADSAVALAPNAPYAWASRAKLRVGLGEPALARTDAEEALRIDPSYELPARSSLASALWALGERASADEELGRARNAIVRPDRPTPTEVYYLASALLRMDRRAEALDLVDSTRPRSAWLWFYLESPDFDEIRDDERFRQVVEASDGRRRSDRPVF